MDAIVGGFDREWLRFCYGPVMQALGEGSRGMVLPDEDDHELLVADYAAIEARVLFWMVDDQSALDIFRRKEDIYCEMATSIYDRPVTKADEAERFMGKQTILGLGYGMGPKKFKAHIKHLSGLDVPYGFVRKVVKIYRKERFPVVPEYWMKTEKAAIESVEFEREVDVCSGDGPVFTYRMEELGSVPFLSCELPSGRKLWYREPRLIPTVNFFFGAEDPTAEPDKEGRRERHNVLVAMNRRDAHRDRAREMARRQAFGEGLRLIEEAKVGVQESSKLTYLEANDGGGIQRVETYGGKIVENNDQGTSCDFLKFSIVQLRKEHGLRAMMTIHDELVASAKRLATKALGDARLRAFMETVERLPEWGSGCPISCEAWRGPRYKKG